MGQLHLVFAEGELCVDKCPRQVLRGFYCLDYNAVCDLVNFLKINVIMLMSPNAKLSQIC